MKEQKAPEFSSKQFSNFICTLTFLCALMVVGIHTYNAGAMDPLSFTARMEGFLAHGIFVSAVPCFFILSGFLFYKNVDNLKDAFIKQKKG